MRWCELELIVGLLECMLVIRLHRSGLEATGCDDEAPSVCARVYWVALHLFSVHNVCGDPEFAFATCSGTGKRDWTYLEGKHLPSGIIRLDQIFDGDDVLDCVTLTGSAVAKLVVAGRCSACRPDSHICWELYRKGWS